jgi:hypothetical protein
VIGPQGPIGPQGGGTSINTPNSITLNRIVTWGDIIGLILTDSTIPIYSSNASIVVGSDFPNVTTA